MADDPTADRESTVTTDPETIEEWARDHDRVPIHEPTESRYDADVRFVPEEDATETQRLEWDEFHEAAERHDLALVARGDPERELSVVRRGEAAERAALDTDEVEDALLAGETVTTEIAETRVIEAEITETETVEHEVVDRETVDTSIIDRKLVDREIHEGEMMDADRMNLEVLDTIAETREEVERLVVESRVTDAELVESDTLTEDEVTAAVDVEGVQETVLQSDLIGGDVDPTRVIEADLVDSEVDEDVVTTELHEHRIAEEEVTERKDVVVNIDEADVLSTNVVTTETIDREIVDRGELATGEIGAGDLGTTGSATDEAGTAGSAVRGGGTMGERPPIPSPDEQGKTVVDVEGQEIGMVADVEGDTMYVDPHVSISDRVKAILDWGEPDEEAYRVPAEKIESIGDEVVLSVHRDEEFQEEH